MKEDLTRYIDRGILLHTGAATWGNGSIHLSISYYSCNAVPPLEYVSSVRGIIFQGDSVLVVKAPQGYYYIVPGGRVEKGESYLQTLNREILEETGWTINTPRIVGFEHLHHLGEKPPDYSYPYPDIIWPVYTAEALDFFPETIIPDKYVLESYFWPIEKVKKLSIDSGQLLLLDSAIQLRRNVEKA